MRAHSQGVNLTGVIEILAHKISLIQNDGIPKDILDIFVNLNQIASTEIETTQIGGGLSYDKLQWGEISDNVIPGLASLLAWLDQTYRKVDDASIINNYHTSTLKSFFYDNRTDFTQTKKAISNTYTNQSVTKNIKRFCNEIYNEYPFHKTVNKDLRKSFEINHFDTLYNCPKTITNNSYQSIRNGDLHKLYSFDNTVNLSLSKQSVSKTFNTTNVAKTFSLESNLEFHLTKKHVSKHSDIRYETFIDQSLTKRTVKKIHRYPVIIQKQDDHAYHKHIKQFKRVPVVLTTNIQFNLTKSTYSRNEVNSLIAGLQAQIDNLAAQIAGL